MPAFSRAGAAATNCDASLFKRLVRQPEPLPGVDVDWSAINLAVDRATVEQALRTDNLGPLFLRGKVGQITHQAGLHQFLRLAAMVELRGAHRVAAGDTADHDRTRRTAGPGNGAIDPFVACRIESLGEFGNGGGFAA